MSSAILTQSAPKPTAGGRARQVLCGLLLSAALTGCASLGADAAVTTQVRTVLDKSPALNSPDAITVQTVHGVVYLRGIVSTPLQIAEAETLARQVPGVVDVQNQLTINNSY